MKRLLIFGCLCISALFIVSISSMAAIAQSIPCDFNNDGAISQAELADGILAYMSGNDSVTLNDARDASHMYEYWDGKALTFVDDAGYTDTVYRPVKRVVDVEGAYGPQTLIALGVKDKLVGVSDSAKQPASINPMVKDLPSVGAASKPDTEKILSLNPDLLHGFSSTYYNLSTQRNVLAHLDIPVVQLDCYKYPTYDNDMLLMGKILGEEDNASKMVEFDHYYKDMIVRNVSKVTDSQKPRVYVESNTNYWTGSVEASYIDELGGINIFDEITASAEVNNEDILKRNPQVIIKVIYKGNNSLQDKMGAVMESGYGVTSTAGVEAYYQKLISRPGWDQIDAVKNGRVYLITSEAQGTCPAAYEMYFAECIHPELFNGTTADDAQRDWYKEFMGSNFTGIFEYPVPTAGNA